MHKLAENCHTLRITDLLNHLQGVADAEAHSHDIRSDHTHRVSPSRLRSASPAIDPAPWLGYVDYLAIQSISHKGDQGASWALVRIDKQRLSDASDRRPSLGEVGGRGGLGCRLESVLDHGLEDVDVLEEPAATLVGDPAKGLRAILVEPFPDLDEAGLVEDLEMTAEVAVGQVAQLLEVREDDAARVGDQRGHDAEPGLLVEDSLQALVSKAARRFLWSGFRRRHGPAPGSGKARRRQAVAPRRREGPWPRG